MKDKNKQVVKLLTKDQVVEKYDELYEFGLCELNKWFIPEEIYRFILSEEYYVLYENIKFKQCEVKEKVRAAIFRDIPFGTVFNRDVPVTLDDLYNSRISVIVDESSLLLESSIIKNNIYKIKGDNMSLKNIGTIILYNAINEIIKDNDITTIDVIQDTIVKDYYDDITGIVLTIENIRYCYYDTEESDILVVTILNLLVHNNNFKLPTYLDAIKISNSLIHNLASNEYAPLSCDDINILSKYYVN